MTELRKALLELHGATTFEERSDGLWMLAPDLHVVALAELMRESEARLSTMTGVACPDGETDVIYHYTIGHDAVNVRARTKGNAIASVALVTAAANWIEREINDLFGVDFVGHPDLSPLVRPAELPAGFYREG